MQILTFYDLNLNRYYIKLFHYVSLDKANNIEQNDPRYGLERQSTGKLID